MKKSILNLAGAQELSKKEQKNIQGGRRACTTHAECGANNCCSVNICYPIGTPGHLCSGAPEYF